MTAQDRSLQQYHQLIQLNAASHLLRIARRIGLFDLLLKGQHTAPQIIEALKLEPELAISLLDALRATGAIEQYGEDFALAQVTRLLSQFDADLGDAMWEKLEAALKDNLSPESEPYHAGIAATQWTHTRTAMEAAEMLNIGEDRKDLKIVDIACGSAVWSCAVAYQDPGSQVTAIDFAGALKAAAATAESIDLGDRFSGLAGDPLQVELPAKTYDMAILAQRLHSEPTEKGTEWLKRIRASLVDGGELIVIDLFQTTATPKLGEAIESLKMKLHTDQGAVRSPQETEQQLKDAGFGSAQFSYLPSSHVNMGLIIAKA